MTAVFKVGERARLISDSTTVDAAALAADGTEVTVVYGLGNYTCYANGVYAGMSWGYVVAAENGNELVCEPHELRKLKTESDDATARQAMLDCIERARQSQGVTA